MNGAAPRRKAVLRDLAALVVAEERGHPLRVAIDGRDAAGKTTLGDELAPLVEALGRPVIRASIDGVHLPQAERYRRGRESAFGYYEDSFDDEAVRRELLAPLGPAGSRRYRTAVFDVRADAPVVTQHARTASARAVALVDGIFLCRPELSDLWDFRIFVEVDAPEAARRDALRVATSGRVGGSAAGRLFETRYAPAQQIYLERVGPRRFADVVVDNSMLAAPRMKIAPRPRARISE